MTHLFYENNNNIFFSSKLLTNTIKMAPAQQLIQIPVEVKIILIFLYK